MISPFRIPPAPQPPFLDRFRETLRREGAAAARTPATLLAFDRERRQKLFYVPFQFANPNPKLVLVGITPGPNQIEMAYSSVQTDLILGLSDETVLAHAKRHAAFGGSRMRPNLLKMLRAFDIPALLGIADATDLWGAASVMLHATSLVPHAAFVNGKPFAGSLDDVLASPILKECFERDFAATLPLISTDALFIALGKTPFDALQWCVGRGLLRREQFLGAFAHPSASGGSRVGVYLGEKSSDALEPRDPVRRSATWLLRQSEAMRRAVVARGGSPRIGPRATQVSVSRRSYPQKLASALKEPAPLSSTHAPTGLHTFVTSGRNKGMVLRPHVSNGCHIVSPSRFKQDYTYVPIGKPLEPYLASGHKLRMSGPDHAPSLIMPNSICGRAFGT